MTKLIVTPIDQKAPGSHRQIREIMRVMGVFQRLQQQKASPGELTDAYEKLEGVLLPHLETDDGRSIAEVLDELSEEQYVELVGGLLAGEAVPEANGAS